MGNTTLGDATTDTLTLNAIPTFNAATATFAVDTNVTLTGGAAGLNFDTNTLSIDASANRVGIGTTAPSVELDVVGSGLFSSNLTVNGNTTLGDATTDTVTLTGKITGASGAAIGFSDGSFTTCTALSTIAGMLTCDTDDVGGGESLDRWNSYSISCGLI